jgi:hypothetical protein
MKKKIKNRIKIKTNKIYKEKMEEFDSKENIEKWLNNRGNSYLKYKFLDFPINQWLKLVEENMNIMKMDKTKKYQNIANFILEKEVFTNTNFYGEDDIYSINSKIPELEKYIENTNITIKPDFVINKINKTDFINILNKREYMFRLPKNFLSLIEHADFINVIGEIKTNPNLINDKKDQKERYIKICNGLNEKYKDKKIYFIIMYVFDNSYVSFFTKSLKEDDPIIFAYIPEIYNDSFISRFRQIENEHKHKINIQIKSGCVPINNAVNFEINWMDSKNSENEKNIKEEKPKNNENYPTNRVQEFSYNKKETQNKKFLDALNLDDIIEITEKEIANKKDGLVKFQKLVIEEENNQQKLNSEALNFTSQISTQKEKIKQKEEELKLLKEMNKKMEEKLEEILTEKNSVKNKINLLNEIIQNSKEEIEILNNKIKIFKNKIVNDKDNINFSENIDTKNDITTDSALSSNFNNNNLLGRKTNIKNFN